MAEGAGGCSGRLFALAAGPVTGAPMLAPGAYVAPSATVVGPVAVGADSSVWFGAVVRADAAPVVVGNESNLQDLVMAHVDPGFPLVVGDRVTVGHKCTLHGCTLQDDCIVGMGSTVMNGAVIGQGAVVGACSVVLEGTVVPPFSLVVGSPATVMKTYARDEALARARENAKHYVARAGLYRRACLPVAVGGGAGPPQLDAHCIEITPTTTPQKPDGPPRRLSATPHAPPPAASPLTPGEAGRRDHRDGGGGDESACELLQRALALAAERHWAVRAVARAGSLLVRMAWRRPWH